ncbi:CU044_5270 family protein [Streptomyces abyssomicinicus]|uniref:CU044_5270 family protein n=1 Tax=Streptomyces abyssomicinicus TaxID=574929 RepID=UPI00124F9EA4|nr:CU044_5270 family protein [Streptomyces abyssomicinicus]
MNEELELLREWDADAAPFSGPARDRARHQLLNAMAHADRRTGTGHPGRRHALRLAAGAVAATAVTGTAVLTGTDGSGEGGAPGTSTPRLENAAATVLNGAAAWEREQEKEPAAPRDDQFIYSKRIIQETEQETGEVKTYTDEMWESVDVSQPSLSMELGREMWEEPEGKGGGVWPPRKWSELKKLPQDPEKLISAIISLGSRADDRSVGDLDASERFEAYWLLGELLKNPVLPEGLRPAAYEALALVPGIRTIPGVKDSAGRTGVGIASTERWSHEGKYLIFDPASYAFLGFRDERISASGKQKYTQLSHVVDWGIVDRVRQRP